MQSVEYIVSEGTRLKADVFHPTTKSRRDAAILLIHGGGWRSGDKRDVARYAPPLVAHGYTVIAVEYRLLPAAPWPAQLEDVMAAVEWTAENAEMLGIDRNRIILEGFSAGGHLALMAGGKRDDIAAIIALFPPTRLSLTPQGPSERSADTLLGPNPTAPAADAASPILLARDDFPPTLLLHGAADWTVDPAASIAMYDALMAAGAPAELHLFPGQHHEFCSVSTMIEPIQNEVASFIDRMVFNAERHAAAAAENPFTLGREGFLASMASMSGN